MTNTDITNYSVVFKNGSGSCTVDTNRSVIYNEKLSNVYIKIHTYSSLNKLNDTTLLNNIYHELNHAYDAFKAKIKDSGLNRYIVDSNRINYPSNVNFHEYWKEIFYHLFSKTEFNALVASVYGDLKAMSSKRENFHNDYKKTLAYKAYNFFIKNLTPIIDNMPSNDISLIMIQMKKNKIPFKADTNNCENTKKQLKNYIKNILARLLQGIGKVASLYYDRDEDVGDKIIHCDNNNDIY